MSRLAIVGGGSWGTALAIALAGRFEEVLLLVRRKEAATRIAATRENEAYLPGLRLADNVTICDGVDGADVVLGVMPSQYARASYRSLSLAQGVPVVSATKGIEQRTLLRMSEVIAEVLPGHPVAVLSGPTFAREVAQGLPAAFAIASADAAVARMVQTLFTTPSLRPYTNADVIGVELGGALKNVIAIAAGICQGLGAGHNTMAALITRGLAEITRVAVAAGGQAHTLSGLAGLGDLVLTCTGELSRNRQVGMQLAAGRTLAEVRGSTNMVAEGVDTTAAALQLAQKLDVAVPITEQLHAILSAGKPPALAIRELMERAPRAE